MSHLENTCRENLNHRPYTCLEKNTARIYTNSLQIVSENEQIFFWLKQTILDNRNQITKIYS